MTGASATSPLGVRRIDATQHLTYIASRPSVSFLQVPSWAAVKSEWQHESVGWFDGDQIVGAGLVLLRKVPRLKRFLAYLPEGPDLPWAGAHTDADLETWLAPLLSHLKSRGAFSVKMGPQVEVRQWDADTLKAAIADGTAMRLQDVPADITTSDGISLAANLASLGWTQQSTTGTGFGDVQPRYVFQIPLAGRSLDEIFASFNQLWRRNIRKAEKSGVVVEHGSYEDLGSFHNIYVETAQRDGFTARGLVYFQRMWKAMTAEDPSRLALYVARHDGRVLAATTMVRVGDHAWYSYGASANEGREVRPSNAIQWAMICDAHAAGASTYNLRGISDTLDPTDRLFGLINFKLGTGGVAKEYVGEWDYPLRPVLARAFNLYLSRH